MLKQILIELILPIRTWSLLSHQGTAHARQCSQSALYVVPDYSIMFAIIINYDSAFSALTLWTVHK